MMGGDRKRPIDALLRAASMLRPLSSEGQLAELVRATRQDVPGVAHVDVRLDAGEPDNARSDGAHRVQDLASGGCIFGAVRIRVGDPRALDANEAVIRLFIDLVGQEIEFRRTQRELREANVNLEHAVTRFADFAHAASDRFWETDATSRYLHMSSGVNWIGAEPHDVTGKTRAEARRALGIVPIGVGQQELDAKEARHEAYRDHATRFRDATGNERTLALSAHPVFDALGVFQGYRGCGRDVTAIERTNAELRRALLAERKMNAQQRRFVAGTGLGLHLCKELVAMQGGALRVESRPGHGSVFRVEIPITPAAPVHAAGAA